MSDRELLELAAKAAGLVGYRFVGGSGMARAIDPSRAETGSIGPNWNPLTDDGDALRLAARLAMSVEISEHEASTYAYAGDVPRVYAMELWRDDRDAATRIAIVRAAAEIGRAASPTASEQEKG